MFSKPTGKLTPLMEQYWEVKTAHPDKVVLFRMGDFYEMFYDDAYQAAPILNIALTSRNKKSADETPMCGVPHHSIATPISKLLSAGLKVAICEQIEDPKVAKGIVKRAVTRILSPGMVYDPETLNQNLPNYLCAFDEETLSFLDTSTGEAFYYRTQNFNKAFKMIEVLRPTEVVLTTSQHEAGLQTQLPHFHITTYDNFAEASGPTSARRLLSYAMYMQGPDIVKTLSNFEERALQQKMELSPQVIRHLELFETYKGDSDGSLFSAMDRTKTSAGTRLLKQWLTFPLLDHQQIQYRHDTIQKWISDTSRLKEVRTVLGALGDVERRIGKISHPNSAPRDLIMLADSLRVGINLSQNYSTQAPSQNLIEHAQKTLLEIERILVDEPPLQTKEGGYIRKGVDTQLDEYIQLTENAHELLVALEQREKEQTGISSLKVRYNNVFGYYIEITHTHKDKVPQRYMRKQTLANAERFITPELQELENKLLSAQSKRVELEQALFAQLKQSVLSRASVIWTLAKEWSELDVLTGLSWLALEHNYKRPVFSKINALKISGGRHPVVEQKVKTQFVPNTTNLEVGDCLLITGPNMAGKSTLMRQVALISLMAQVGSFVPAEQAVLPVFDRIYTRIGASDFLTEGLSTFMVEMKETAEMLQQATENSLLILDEVGRGTSTYDGLSLAQSLLEYLVEHKKSMTLFATHYHELTQLAARYPQVKNAHMAIKEKSGDIHFLYTLMQGPANKSYGIQVAQLAGMPKSVIKRAKEILNQLETSGMADSQQLSLMPQAMEESTPLPENYSEVIEQLKQMSVQTTTPLEALNKIVQWQQNLS